MKSMRFLTLFALLTLSSCSEGNYKLFAIFNNVEGLSEDSEVRASGLKIGHVEKMWLDEKGNVVAELHINNDVAIPVGSEIAIENESMVLADKHIEVDIKPDAEKNHNPGDILIGKTRNDLLLEENNMPDSLAVEKLHQLIDTLAGHKRTTK